MENNDNFNRIVEMNTEAERRKIERDFYALAQRFVNHCRLYGITIKPQKQDNYGKLQHQD